MTNMLKHLSTSLAAMLLALAASLALASCSNDNDSSDEPDAPTTGFDARFLGTWQWADLEHGTYVPVDPDLTYTFEKDCKGYGQSIEDGIQKFTWSFDSKASVVTVSAVAVKDKVEWKVDFIDKDAIYVSADRDSYWNGTTWVDDGWDDFGQYLIRVK